LLRGFGRGMIFWKWCVKMFLKIKSLAILIVLSTNFSYAQEQLNVKKFNDRCVQEGAGNVINELTQDWDRPVWDMIIENISSGDEDWLNTLYCMKAPAYSSVTVSLELDIALATALPKNPQAVLGLGAAGISLTNACSLPFFERDRKYLEQSFKETLQALENVPDDATLGKASLAIERDVCILRLKDAYANEMKR